MPILSKGRSATVAVLGLATLWLAGGCSSGDPGDETDGAGGREVPGAGGGMTSGGAGGVAAGAAGAAATAGSSGRGGATGVAGSGGSAGAGVAGLGGRPGGPSGGAGGGTAAAGRGGGAPSAGGGPGAGGSPGAGGGSAEVCARWKGDRANLGEGTWSGAVATCTVGDMTAEARDNALRLVNLYRWLAALPPVTLDPVRNQKDQACALMMRANNMLSHEPPTTWTCYDADGAEAAGNSNISSGPAVSSVDLYMIDPGNDTTIGHRRWLLSNSLGPIGVGGTDKSSCLWTLGGTGKAGKAWLAWPAPGTIPLQAIAGARGQTVDATGWTVQSDSINLASAQVTVTVDGAPQPVTVTQLGGGYGSKYAFRFNPMGWTTAAGKTYNVAVTGVSTAISYAVEVVDCR
jgi:hypothetical protein